MKALMTITGLLLLSIFVMAQEETMLHQADDNYFGEQVQNYVDKELRVICLSKPLLRYGYHGFVLDPSLNLRDSINIYACCDGAAAPRYDMLYSKTFTVLDVLSDTEEPEELGKYGDRYFLKLLANHNSDTLYYEYFTNYETSFPFVLLDYEAALKERYTDLQYMVRGKNWVIPNMPMEDYRTAQPVSFQAGSMWTCKGITTDTYNCRPSLILENDKGEQIVMDVKIEQAMDASLFLTKEQAAEYRGKWGDEVFKMILDRQVNKGFTEEMVRLSLGDPDYVESKDGKVLWTYRGNQIAFEGGKVAQVE